MPNNDSFANAEEVVIPTNGATFTSPTYDSIGYTLEAGEPASPSGGGHTNQSAWWKYTPASSGTARIDTQLSTGDTQLTVFTGGAINALTQVGFDDDSGGSSTALIDPLSVTARTTYWIRITNYSAGTNIKYVLRVTGPASTQPQTAAMPPAETVLMMTAGFVLGADMPAIQTDVDIRSGVVSAVIMAPIDIEATVEASGGRLHKADNPPLDLYAYQGVPTLVRLALTLLDPSDQALVPVTTPVVAAQLHVVEGSVGRVGVDVEYSQTDTFANPVRVSADVDLVHGANIVYLPAGQALADGATYFWRARLTVDGVPSGWLPVRQFTVDTAAGDKTVRATWTVIDGPTDPHLWFVTPAAGVPGDEVTVVGQGFSHGRGTVELAGIRMPVQRWTHMPALDTVYSDDRIIDGSGGQIDPEHDKVVVLVPDVPPPGGPLVVVDGDGSIPPDIAPTPPVLFPPVTLESSLSLDTFIRPKTPPLSLPPLELERLLPPDGHGHTHQQPGNLT